MAVRDVTNYFSSEELELFYDKYVKEIDGVTYYFKTNDTIYNELLSCEIFKLLGLPVVDLELVLIDGQLYIMSKSYREEDKVYLNGYDILESYLETLTVEEKKEMGLNPLLNNFGVEDVYPSNSLETIWQALSHMKLGIENIREVMIGFIKLYSMSIMLGDVDFHPGNWEIEIDQGIARLVPKYDNGLTFYSCESVNSFFVDSSDAGKKAIASLEYFLSISCKEDKDIFYDLLYYCHDELFAAAMNNVDTKYGDCLQYYFSSGEARMSKQYILRRFKKTRESIYNLKEEMELMGR